MIYETNFPGTSQKAIVGGFFEPSISAILDLNPDLVIISDRHEDIKKWAESSHTRVLVLKITSISDGMNTILLLGDIFDKKEQAKTVIDGIRADIDLVQKKLSSIEAEKRLRVMRIMGRNTVMTPGSDSFQQNIIQMAGGAYPIT